MLVEGTREILRVKKLYMVAATRGGGKGVFMMKRYEPKLFTSHGIGELWKVV